MKTAIEIYHIFNPGQPVRSPKASFIKKPINGEYGLRWFDKRRYQDIVELLSIDQQEILLHTMHPKTPSTTKYILDVFNTQYQHHLDHYYVFAIVNSTHKIVGWVQFMVDEYRSQIKKFANLNRQSRLLEVSYAKIHDQTHQGVAVHGLKYAIDIINKMDNNDSKELYITAYTDPTNTASEKVLQYNNFQKLNHQIIYINEISNIWIKKVTH